MFSDKSNISQNIKTESHDKPCKLTSLLMNKQSGQGNTVFYPDTAFYMYSKTSKFRTPIFRNTCLFEIKFGHIEFLEYGLYINFKNICFECIKETSPWDVSFMHSKQMFD